MDCTDYKVACHCGSHGDFGGLTVSDFADADDIRVLSQNGSQTVSKGHTRLFIYLNLCDSVYVVFNRVLKGNEVGGLAAELLYHGVHGGGFTASCRTYDEDYAAGMRHKPVKAG